MYRVLCKMTEHAAIVCMGVCSWRDAMAIVDMLAARGAWEAWTVFDEQVQYPY